MQHFEGRVFGSPFFSGLLGGPATFLCEPFNSLFHCQVEILNILYCYAKCVVALSTGLFVVVLWCEMFFTPCFRSST